MKNKFRKVAVVLLTVIFIVSSSIFLLQLYQQHIAKNSYNQASEIAINSDAAGIQAAELPEEVHPVMNLDLALLQKVNEDVMTAIDDGLRIATYYQSTGLQSNIAKFGMILKKRLIIIIGIINVIKKKRSNFFI